MKIYDNGIYRDATSAEIAEIRMGNNISPEQEIAACKAELAATDYKAIKYAEGIISAEDYAPTKEYRQSLRDRINELEELLKKEPEL